MTRTRPPAWYPDPRDPGQLRRWDGRAWTADVRPFPGWLRTLHLAPGPDAPGPSARHANRTNVLTGGRTTRRLWVASALCVVLALVLLDILGRGGTLVERISDRRFVAAADGACQRTWEADLEPNAERLRGDAEVERLHRLVAAQDELVDELRSLPVAAADERAVDAWLAAWDTWTTAGHRYVQAFAAGNETQAREVSTRSREAKQRIDAFAAANGMQHCVLFRQ